MIFSMDSESEYSKGHDIRSLGVQQYVRQTNHYMVSSYGDFNSVEATENFDWSKLDGATVVLHNASYDKAVIDELRRRGMTIPHPKEYFCTADAIAYLQCPRSLASGCAHILGLNIDKEIRADMKGRTWASMDDAFRMDVARYCYNDSRRCWELWQAVKDKWPEFERRVSQHTTMMCHRGIAVDLPQIEEGISHLAKAKWQLEKQIPWVGKVDEKGKELAVSSVKEINKRCAECGLELPPCTDAKDDEFQEWLDSVEGKADFITAVQNWRRANRLQKVLMSMSARQTDGVLTYSLRYFGAPHTGRWNGDQGLNMLNFPKKPFMNVDARACLIPRPGKKFVHADFSQVEARVALWLARDSDMLARMHKGEDIYEAHARNTMGYTDPRPLKETNPDLRQFAKCRVLGLGYGMGADKFQKTVKQWIGKDISFSAAKDMVDDYRQRNPKILACWRRLEHDIKQSRGEDYQVVLPSGRTITYFDVSETLPVFGRVEQGDVTKRLYGGKLFENTVQGIARDLLAHAILRLENAGLPVVLHVHDEVLCEVPERDAEEGAKAVHDLMTTLPDWAKGLPVASDVKIRNEYGK